MFIWKYFDVKLIWKLSGFSRNSSFMCWTPQPDVQTFTQTTLYTGHGQTDGQTPSFVTCSGIHYENNVFVPKITLNKCIDIFVSEHFKRINKKLVKLFKCFWFYFILFYFILTCQYVNIWNIYKWHNTYD